MKITCPCCAGKGEIDDAPPVPLTPMQAKIFDAARKSIRGVRADALIDAQYFYRADGGPENARRVLHVQVKKANVRLAAAGLQITTMIGGRRSLFYRVAPL